MIAERLQTRIGHVFANPALLQEALDLPENFLWLADIQQDATENLYVDQIHYNPILSRQMAQSLAEKIHVQFDSKAVTNEQSQ